MNASGLTLTTSDLAKLEDIHACLIIKQDADKVKAIILLSKGWSYAQIEEALLLNERTIHRYRSKFLTGGIDELLDNKYKGGFSKLSYEEKAQLAKELRNNIYPNSASICHFIKKTFGKTYTAQGIVPLLHSIGFSYKKTKAVPGKMDVSKQKEFIKEYEKSRKTGKKIYFGDSVHPTYNMLPDYAWLPTGEETYIKSNPGRQRINIVGVYSPNDQSVIAADYETVDANAIMNMLKKIRKANPNNKPLILYLDNARYNYNKKVSAFAATLRIELKYLPPYSPNLNLIERLWKYMKQEILANRYHETFNDFRDECMEFFKRRSALFKKKLSTLMAENFHLFPVPAD